MKSHLCRFFTWLCMKTSVVSRRRLFISISFLLHFVHVRSLATEIIVVNKLSTISTWSSWWPKTTYFPLGDQGCLYFCMKMNCWAHCLSWVLSTSVNTSLHICDFLKSIDTFFPELLKSWLSTFWDPGHCSDGSIRTRLFWCCRAATEFGSQSPHQGT